MDNTINIVDRPHEFICIVCPVGCPLQIEGDGDELIVIGNACPRGETYGRQEYLRPMRVVTSLAAVRGGDRPLVSVKTYSEIEKARIPEAIGAIRSLRVDAPIEIGQVLAEDLAGTGVPLVATSAVGINR
ncbi:NAD(FAD)-dependent dehydrogenase [Clostridia bacterium]|nr:NAD(FAD)-dependent dehydrogenase [Clostridia bacterium]